ncbi:MAG: hypothetical protein HRT72_09610 [Flavobacteriales bacterium]|nr:hypothetical protein [Flavobacteriales bacterium]
MLRVFSFWKDKFFIGLLAFCLFSCDKKSNVRIVFGYDYYPSEVGMWRIYNVDSIAYDDFYSPSKVDTFVYEIKEVIDSSFIDNAGNETYKINRYKRGSDTLQWDYKEVWTSTLLPSRVEVVEGSTRYIKMTFPINEGESWNGNAFNSVGEESYIYSSIDTELEIGGITFDSTLVVTEVDNENLIERKYTAATYAKNVGAVYKRDIDISTETSGEIISGFDLIMSLSSFGN